MGPGSWAILIAVNDVDAKAEDLRAQPSKSALRRTTKPCCALIRET